MKFIGIILLLAIAYFVWRFVVRGDALVIAGPGGGKVVTASLDDVEANEALMVAIDNNEKNNFVTVISMPRDLAGQLGVSPPEGFVEELLPLSEREKNDKEAVEYAQKYNAETLRWAGNLALEPNGVTKLRIPAQDTSHLDGRISFQYEAKLGLGGSMSFFWLNLGGSSEGRTPEALPEPPTE